ncbi:MAG: formylglycine-generating enzyme family protein [Deltaproteobacteria bacterium]|jgi:formylglycine-generating enzyme required for sulfatase activity|nr:formylglycine-generating enzyme family protein [Deltaproteobacteria bacterium]
MGANKPQSAPPPVPATLSALVLALALAIFWPAPVPAQAQPQLPIVTNSVDMTFVSIPKGSFSMGAGPGFQGEGEYERPAHEVTIPKPFRLSRSEVTIEQWNRVMGNARVYGDKSRGKGSVPIDNVSWEDALAFAQRLSELGGGIKYRLPTEAEWEYAARAGTTTAYHFGDDPKLLDDYAWCGGGFASGSPYPVMGKKPNGFGLYDMHGNLSEWVSDWFAPDYYSRRVGQNPKGPTSGEEKVHRGGAFASDPKSCQSAWRESDLPTIKSVNIGFRLAYDE